jgi:uncharacterized protein (TIGR02186 family)
LFKRLIFDLGFLVAVMTFFPQPAFCAVPVTVNARPNKIMIGVLFSGADVTVSGTIPAGSEAVVVVTGQQQDLPLKKKGRVLGFLWMNLGSQTFHHVPTVYIVNTPKSLEPSGDAGSGEGQGMDVGFESLKAQAEITPTPDPGDKALLLQEFLKLKEGEGLYGVNNGTVHYGETKDGMRSFETDIHIPARVAPGEYKVKVEAFNGGHVVDASTQHIEVEEVGVPALLSSLSFKHGGVYGLLAVVVAIGAGLLMDFFFRGQRGAH